MTRLAWSLGGLALALVASGYGLALAAGVQSAGEAVRDVPLLAGFLAFSAVGALIAARRPASPVGWLLLAAGAALAGAVFAGGYAQYALLGGHGPLRAGALAASFAPASGALGIALGSTFTLLLLPDGRLPSRRWRPVLWSAAAGLALILVGILAAPDAPEVAEDRFAGVANPLAIEGSEAVMRALVEIGYAVLVAAFAAALCSVALRFRRSAGEERQRLGWIVLAIGLIALSLAVHLLIGGPDELATITIGLLPVAIGIAVLRHGLLDIDLLVRRSVVYGALWLLITLAYVGVAAAFGIAAGARLPVALAVMLAIVATLVAQPARRRLERLAGRWVFGEHPSEHEVLARFGELLERVAHPDRLAAGLAEAVRAGLGVRWTRVSVWRGAAGRVRLEEAAAAGPVPEDGSPDLSMPMVHAGEPVGIIECGSKEAGPPLASDRDLLATLAAHAAVAIRNATLAVELAARLDELRAQARELAASRARLVRAQDAERRRIERDIHDGAQQELVALLTNLGLARQQLRRGALVDDALAQLQEDTRHAIADLRELVLGIRPSLLGDQGLVVAIEARAARAPIPVEVVRDPSLDGHRFPDEIEAAAYFVVVEALANVLKHADATSARVELGGEDGRLRLSVTDDGAGFDPGNASGSGLASLADRVEALGGTLRVSSAPAAGTCLVAELPVEVLV